MGKDLSPLLNPQSIALVGASGSSDSAKLSFWPLEYLLQHGYQGRIYPVNPRYDEIRGFHSYPSIADLPEGVDAAVLMLSAEQTVAAISELAARGVKSAVVTAAGFSEAGPAGERLEKRLRDLATDSDLILCGPNTNGIVNLNTGATLAWIPILRKPLLKGNVAILSQSGAMISSMAERLRSVGIGCSCYVSLGNQAVTGLPDYLSHLATDPDTQVIVLFMEGLKERERFIAAVRECQTAGKRVVVLKTGASEAGQAAAEAHTGTLAGAFRSYQAFFRRHRMIQVHNLDELANVVQLLSMGAIPASSATGIMTTSGGLASVMADQAERADLQLPPLPADIQHQLTTEVSLFSAINPLDLGGRFVEDLRVLEQAMAAFVNLDSVHSLILGLGLLPPLRLQPVLDHFVAAHKGAKKPFLVYSPGSLDQDQVRWLRQQSIPLFDELVNGLAAVRIVAEFAASGGFETLPVSTPPFGDVRLPSAKGSSVQAVAESGIVNEDHCRDWFQRYNLTVAAGGLVANVNQAVGMAAQLGYPVVLKGIAPGVSHKSDSGLVHLNIGSDAELHAAFTKVLTALSAVAPAGGGRLLMEEMVADAVPLILGGSCDPVLGPMVVVGMGGIFTEILNDAVIRVAPVSSEEAREMLSTLRGFRVLEGYRRGDPYDIGAAVDALVQFSHLVFDLGSDVKNVEINPLMVLPKGGGVRAVDGLMILSARKGE